MKRYALFAGMIVISACSSLNFDSLAYDRFLTVSEQADQLSRECASPDVIRSGSGIILDRTTHMKIYADHRGVSPEVALSVNTLQSMASELNARYVDDKSPSPIYCQEKLKLISRTAIAISDTMGHLN